MSWADNSRHTLQAPKPVARQDSGYLLKRIDQRVRCSGGYDPCTIHPGIAAALSRPLALSLMSHETVAQSADSSWQLAEKQLANNSSCCCPRCEMVNKIGGQMTCRADLASQGCLVIQAH